jgi:uncharacterized membrane protein
MKTLLNMLVGTMSLLTAGVSLAQSGGMMNGSTGGTGWMGGYGAMGGFGGIWVPALCVIVVIGIVAWVVTQKRK